MSKGTHRKGVEYYDDEGGKIRWRVRNENGRITGSSEEGFNTLRAAMDSYEESLRPAGKVTVNTKKGKKKDDDHTAEGSDRPIIADNAGSAGESEDPNREGGPGETSRSGAGGSGTDGSDSGS